MSEKENLSRIPNQQELVYAMGGVLRLMLDDIRAQFRHVRYEYGRLNKAGVAVGQMMTDLGFQSKEEKVKQVEASTDR